MEPFRSCEAGSYFSYAQCLERLKRVIGANTLRYEKAAAPGSYP